MLNIDLRAIGIAYHSARWAVPSDVTYEAVLTHHARIRDNATFKYDMAVMKQACHFVSTNRTCQKGILSSFVGAFCVTCASALNGWLDPAIRALFFKKFRKDPSLSRFVDRCSPKNSAAAKGAVRCRDDGNLSPLCN